MGTGTFNPSAYRTYSASTAGKSTAHIYTSRGMKPELDPKGVTFRESRDSADNPQSTPFIVALDVTGSMGILADAIARQGLGTLFEGILARKPITDPHLMFMAVGDHECDNAPLQVSQFEADNRIIEQLTGLWLEGGGGGNLTEGYQLPWYFAANHTVTDSMVKRGKRGYLFTVGDEEAPRDLTRAHIAQVFGDSVEVDYTPAQLLASAQRSYDVYHVIIEQGHHAQMNLPRVQQTWRELLGQHVISLSDYTKLAETIVAAIQVAEGTDHRVASSGWGAGTDAIVGRAVGALASSSADRPRLGGPRT